MKRFRLVIRVSDHVLDEIGVADTGEDAVADAVSSLGLTVEEIEGLDYWTDPEGEPPANPGDNQ